MDDELLAEQVAYYRARAATYHEELYSATSPSPAYGALTDRLGAVLDRLGAGGDALELACGTGAWTEWLVPRCRSVRAVDASPEMLAIAAERAPGATFEQADVLAPGWFDTIFFGFWLSQEPADLVAQPR